MFVISKLPLRYLFLVLVLRQFLVTSHRIHITVPISGILISISSSLFNA